ncbi:YggS family pyridoxal phosphate enzyme [Pseudofrankia sp. BMG5.37]|uniref:YggS family pyridoxal phosphate enzyme n=1 Tax=Pseudofrankia sp. BMG5.36 TaxID=1834512 RepID=UPI001F52B2D5|nr:MULTISPECIES: YggS family pyridoxal phosphate enzyme [unclassified Pseudofrankia]MDT3441079.1 YggS family pyridoxal phosphate enzyme [Pseudofrankia sp. BMG5.37]
MTSGADLARLRANLGEVRERIAVAARAAGREPAELTLIAVSKTWPAADVLALRALGVTHFAENREQEAAPKVAEVLSRLGTAASSQAARPAGAPGAGGGLGVPGRLGPAGGADGPGAAARVPVGAPVWHFVGQLQRNKANAVARWADWVQSVDRPELVASLSRAAASQGRMIAVCVQVCLDTPGATGRGGAAPGDVARMTDLVAEAAGLRLAGVMAVAPRGVPPRPAFARLREVAEEVRRNHPEARVVSAGMSGDLEAAVAEGATHLRIGTALFGERRPVP